MGDPEVSAWMLETRGGDTLITDLHIWQLGVNKFAAIISVVAHQPKSPGAYKQSLAEHEELVYVTVEVERCEMAEGAHA